MQLEVWREKSENKLTPFCNSVAKERIACISSSSMSWCQNSKWNHVNISRGKFEYVKSLACKTELCYFYDGLR